MHCIIMNGSPAESKLDNWLQDFSQALQAQGHKLRHFHLRDMNINYCTGCWSCWWKTPGLCVFRDDMDIILPEMANADLVLWASPMILGAPSALLKRAQDRFIPLAHPYIELYQGECHHRHRYEKNADIAVVLEPAADDNPADIDMAFNFFRRFSLNTRTSLRFCATTSQKPEEVLHGIA